MRHHPTMKMTLTIHHTARTKTKREKERRWCPTMTRPATRPAEEQHASANNDANTGAALVRQGAEVHTTGQLRIRCAHPAHRSVRNTRPPPRRRRSRRSGRPRIATSVRPRPLRMARRGTRLRVCWSCTSTSAVTGNMQPARAHGIRVLAWPVADTADRGAVENVRYVANRTPRACYPATRDALIGRTAERRTKYWQAQTNELAKSFAERLDESVRKGGQARASC